MKNRVMVRLLAFCLVLCLFCSVLPLSSGAFYGMEYPKYLAEDGSETEALSAFIDTDALRDYLKNALKSCPGSVDISKFKIPRDQLDALRVFIWREIPECFHVYGLGAYYGDPIPRITASYSMDANEYAEKLQQCEAVAAKLVEGVAGNDSLSEEQKALIIHDRLAVHNEYDYTFSDDSATMYAALVKRNSVCDGYTKAYAYLLRLCGVECTNCVSYALNHSWNLVKVDGQFYHVDVTWDDPSWKYGERGILGSVNHENFLRSNSGIYDTMHTASDYYKPADSTKYDEYFWSGSSSAFQLVGDDIYYIDGNSQKLMRLNDDGVTGTVLYSVEATWSAGSGYSWIGNFSRLDSEGDLLFFTTNDTVYVYDLSENTAKSVLKPKLADGDSIYGLKYEDGFIICDINDCPGNDVTRLRQIREKYEVNYTVTFKDYDGTVISSKTYKSGAEVTEPDAPVRPADKTFTYTFIGWDNPVTTVNGNAEYTAVYTADYIDYTVSFYNYDGSLISSGTYHCGDDPDVPADPVKEEDETFTYTFSGWDSEVTSVSGDAVYTAKFKAAYKDYIVVFKDYDGSVISSRSYRYGDAVDVPAEPQRPADETYTYTFYGWDKPVEDVSGDAEYTATYVSEFIEYIIRFVDWDGAVLSEKTYRYGDAVNIPEAPERPDDEMYTYTFDGWDKEITAVTGDAEYTAVYTATLKEENREYSVIFKDFDGSVISSGTYHKGDAVTVPDEPGRPADETYTYTFNGWDKPVTDVDGDAEYTAVYSAEYINYTVAFYNYDGSEISSDTYHYGDGVTAPEAPERPGDETYVYIFAGWDSEVTAVSGDAVYTAVFKEEYRDYTVIFRDYDNSIISEKTYHYGDAVEVPAEPGRPADETYTYAFDGWDKPAEDVRGDAEYTATYVSEFIEYTIRFVDWDGSVLSEQTYHYGDTVTAPDDPERAPDGDITYTFTGWDKEIQACAGDETYTATYQTSGGAEIKTASGKITANKPVVIALTDADGNIIAEETAGNGEFELEIPDGAEYILVSADGYIPIIYKPAGDGGTDINAELKLAGDVNGDRAVNNKDVTVLFRYVSGVGVTVDRDCADTNCDGGINNKDVTVLFRFVSSPDAKLKVTPIIMY